MKKTIFRKQNDATIAIFVEDIVEDKMRCYSQRSGWFREKYEALRKNSYTATKDDIRALKSHLENDLNILNVRVINRLPSPKLTTLYYTFTDIFRVYAIESNSLKKVGQGAFSNVSEVPLKKPYNNKKIVFINIK